MKDSYPIPRALFGQLATLIIDEGAKRVTKFLTPRLVVKATRKVYRGETRRQAMSSRVQTMVFTVGPPNYGERVFIKKCKKADEPFPIKKLRIVWLTNTKSRKKVRK